MEDGLEEFARELAFGAGSPNWLTLLHAYRWRGTDWTCGVLTRARFHAEWRDIQSTFRSQQALPGPFVRWAHEVACDWAGHSESLDSRELQLIWQALRTDSLDPPVYFGTTQAAGAALYAMAKPKAWAMYDRRVAAALQALAAKRYGSIALIPPAWQFVGPGAASAEAFQSSFARASSLTCTIAAILRHEGSWQPGAVLRPGEKRGDERWQVWHVEMALFVLGSGDGGPRTE